MELQSCKEQTILRDKETWNFMSAIGSLRFNLSSVSLHCGSYSPVVGTFPIKNH
jgi:hypothetical protein